MAQIQLPKPPRTTEKMGREVYSWFIRLHARLTESAQILWDQVDKATSSLADLDVADHDMLGNVLGADDTDTDVVQDKHVSNNDIKDIVDDISALQAGAISDHGGLSGLADDDHTQYHNDTRGDARYYTQTQIDALFTSGTFTPVYEGATTAGTNSGTYDGSYYTINGLAFVTIHIDQTTNTGGVGVSQIDISASGLSQVTTDTPAIGEVMADGLANVCSACSIVAKIDSNSSIIKLFTSSSGNNSAIDVDTGAMELWLTISFEI